MPISSSTNQLIEWATPLDDQPGSLGDCCKTGIDLGRVSGDNTNPLLNSCQQQTSYDFVEDTCKETNDFVLEGIDYGLTSTIQDNPTSNANCCARGEDDIETGSTEPHSVGLLWACQTEKEFDYDHSSDIATYDLYALNEAGQRISYLLEENVEATKAESC